MELSKRLSAVAAMAEPGDRMADIGTDHGFLPIFLVRQGISPSAIAMDVGDGPLERARTHVREQGLEDKIVLRKSDGFHALAPGEADAAVIAGMGGPLMVRILEEGRRTVESLRYLILSPQSEIPSVRRYLLRNGFAIRTEEMVLDEGKYYTVMKAWPGKGTEVPWSRIEERYGRSLLREAHPVLLQYLRKERETLSALRERLLSAGTDRARERLSQVERELLDAEEALKICEGGEDIDALQGYRGMV